MVTLTSPQRKAMLRLAEDPDRHLTITVYPGGLYDRSRAIHPITARSLEEMGLIGRIHGYAVLTESGRHFVEGLHKAEEGDG